MEDPTNPDPAFQIFDDIFTQIYILEMFLKIFALGFIMKRNSYLRDNWNILDFIIVVTGFISQNFEL
jgi:hypothetical protein